MIEEYRECWVKAINMIIKINFKTIALTIKFAFKNNTSIYRPISWVKGKDNHKD